MALTGYNCTIGNIGMHQSAHLQVNLTDLGGAFASVSFRVPDDRKREYLAMLLTALTTSRPVNVYMETITSLSLIEAIYLARE
jgi:hypothetical protein